MSDDRKINKVAIIFMTTEKLPLSVEKRHLDMIKKNLPDSEVIYTETEEEMLDKKFNADVLLAWGLSTPSAYCRFATNLKWIFAFSAGVEGLMKPEILDLKLRISCAKGIHGRPMADHVLGFILSFLRCFPTFNNQQKKKIWKKMPHGSIGIQESIGKTVGIIGLGEIGKEIAKKCKAFDMRVLGVKRTSFPIEFVDEVYPSEKMDKVLEESDFVIILVPITPDTVHLIDKSRLAKLKNTAYLINVGRGPVVDEKALVDALREGKIAGAAIDVAEIEPLPQDSPLWTLPNVIITPHTAADTPFYMDRAFEMFCKNIERFEKGEKLISEIDVDAKY